MYKTAAALLILLTTTDVNAWGYDDIYTQEEAAIYEGSTGGSYGYGSGGLRNTYGYQNSSTVNRHGALPITIKRYRTYGGGGYSTINEAGKLPIRVDHNRW